MAKFTVKAESLAVRCEICHQADLFEPATGVCTRCLAITLPTDSGTTVHPVPQLVHHFRYTGISPWPAGRMVRNVLLSGLAAASPGFILPSFVFLEEGSFGALPLLFGVFFIPSSVSAFLTGKRLQRGQEFCTVREFRDFAGWASFYSTVMLVAGMVPLCAVYQMVKFHAPPMLALENSLYILCPSSYIFLCNLLGSLLIPDVLKFLERSHIEERWD